MWIVVKNELERMYYFCEVLLLSSVTLKAVPPFWYH